MGNRKKKHMMKNVAVEDKALLNGSIKTVQSPNNQIIAKRAKLLSNL